MIQRHYLVQYLRWGSVIIVGQCTWNRDERRLHEQNASASSKAFVAILLTWDFVRITQTTSIYGNVLNSVRIWPKPDHTKHIPWPHWRRETGARPGHYTRGVDAPESHGPGTDSLVKFILLEFGFGMDFIKFDRICNRILHKIAKMRPKPESKYTKLD